MAVFTPVTHEELEQWLAPLHLGTLVAHKGIASGIENSNFFVTLARDGVHTDYVLTIFEVLKAEQLPFYLELMQHDKKVKAGKIRLILMQALGQAVLTSDYDQKQLERVLSLG